MQRACVCIGSKPANQRPASQQSCGGSARGTSCQFFLYYIPSSAQQCTACHAASCPLPSHHHHPIPIFFWPPLFQKLWQLLIKVTVMPALPAAQSKGYHLGPGHCDALLALVYEVAAVRVGQAGKQRAPQNEGRTTVCV